MVEPKPREGVAWGRRYSEFNSGERDIDSLADLTQAATEGILGLEANPESAQSVLNSIWGVYSFVRPLLDDLDTKGTTPKGVPVEGAAAFDKRFKDVREMVGRKLPGALEDRAEGYPKKFYAIRDALGDLFNDVMAIRQNQGLGFPANRERSRVKELSHEIRGT